LTCLPRKLIMTRRGSSRRITPHSQLTCAPRRHWHVCLEPLSTSFYI